MERILATIKRAIDERATEYVHCWGGIGRTGTVVGCWMVQEAGLTDANSYGDGRAERN
jgi:protein-tyrosine phosphatase